MSNAAKPLASPAPGRFWQSLAIVVLACLAGTIVGAAMAYFGSRNSALAWGWAPLGAAGGAVLGALSGWKFARELRRQASFKALAVQLGFDYAQEGPDRVASRLKQLTGAPSRVELHQAVSGDVGRGKLVLGEMSYRQSSSNRNNSRVRQTVAFFEHPDFNLPEFSLKPEGVLTNLLATLAGAEDIDFEHHPQFSKAYHLSGTKSAAIRDLFDRSLLDLLAAHRGWEIRGEERTLVLLRPYRRLKPSQLPKFLVEAQTIFTAFESAATAKESRVSQESKSLAAAPRQSTDEAIDAFLKSPPPREVPKTIARQQTGAGCCIAAAIGLPLLGVGSLVTLGGLSVEEGESSRPLWFGVAMLAVAIVALWLGAGNRFRVLRILHRGKLIAGRIEAADRIGDRKDNQISYMLRIAYEVEGKPFQSRIAVYGDHARLARAAYAGGEAVELLYDPEKPTRIRLALQMKNKSSQRW